MEWAKAFILWCAIIPFAILNGLARDKFLVRMFGPKPARTVSGVTLSAVILLFTTVTITWLPPFSPLGYLGIGVCWLILTIGFEFFFGRIVAKRTWADLLRPYRFEDGDLWPLVLVVVTVSPLLAALFRRLI
ncbi:MAG TPA: hypothetical protein VEC99_09245 [Clostridia bacterium]|nr:hypothetical protein [Clostridia bacterium]